MKRKLEIGSLKQEIAVGTGHSVVAVTGCKGMSSAGNVERREVKNGS